MFKLKEIKKTFKEIEYIQDKSLAVHTSAKKRGHGFQVGGYLLSSTTRKRIELQEATDLIIDNNHVCWLTVTTHCVLQLILAVTSYFDYIPLQEKMQSPSN